MGCGRFRGVGGRCFGRDEGLWKIRNDGRIMWVFVRTSRRVWRRLQSEGIMRRGGEVGMEMWLEESERNDEESGVGWVCRSFLTGTSKFHTCSLTSSAPFPNPASEPMFEISRARQSPCKLGACSLLDKRRDTPNDLT